MITDEFLDVLRSRRSVRSFLSDPVPQSDIEKIITAAAWAPSGTNKQNWGFILAVSEGVRKAMKDAVAAALAEAAGRVSLADAKNVFNAYAANFTFFVDAPVVVAVVKMPYESITQKIMKRYDIKGTKTTADVQGPSAAVQNLLLAAHSMGYGACWMTGPLIAKEKLELVLGISPPDELMALVPVGRPALMPDAPPRKGISEITRYL